MPFKYKKIKLLRSTAPFYGTNISSLRFGNDEVSPSAIRALKESEARLRTEDVKSFSIAEMDAFFNSL